MNIRLAGLSESKGISRSIPIKVRMVFHDRSKFEVELTFRVIRANMGLLQFFYSHVPEGESIDIRVLVDYLGYRRSAAMSCTGLYPYEYRR